MTVRALYMITVFLGSALLFLVQPLAAKLILPAFGGASSVWTTCMLFFQALLLAGYAYAHGSFTVGGPPRQRFLHAVVLLLPVLLLPVGFPPGFDPARHGLPPALALLGVLAVGVGAPFFALSAGTPVLQRWYAASGGGGRDPYFLYAASNFGSFAGLLGYPVLLEPGLPLGSQTRAWSAGFVLYAALALLCAFTVRKHPAVDATETGAGRAPVTTPPPRPGERAAWIVLSAVPCSLLLGVTSFLTTNVAPVPLLWVVPLGLYLLTLCAAFARPDRFSTAGLGRALGVLAAPVAALMVIESSRFVLATATLHLVFFTLGALFCHVRLSRMRPPAQRLTGYYLCISLGGVLGGVFNALLAPVVFRSLAEYPIALVTLLLLLPRRSGAPSPRADLLCALGTGVLAAAPLLAMGPGWENAPWRNAAIIGPPILFAFLWAGRPMRYALSLGAVFLVSNGLHSACPGRVLAADRNFYGVHRVIESPDGRLRAFLNGNTVHGCQLTAPEARRVATSYYHATGPAGQVLAALKGSPRARDVGVVGLGAGVLAAHAEPGQTFTFFELDPYVIRVATDPGLFTFLSDCRGRVRIVPGDARLTLRHQPAHSLDLLVLDAFTSDSIPVHVMTREAVALYLEKLRPNGLVLFHVSNHYLDLSRPLACTARDLGLTARLQRDNLVAPRDRLEKKDPSWWVLMGRSERDMGPLARDPRWQPLSPLPGDHPWTDDYSNLLGVFRFRN
ncbi:MAG: fused MFS/spermidine synthase [Acidobacteria bacterium]|nr:fused MFS/spermidine synthase [Acidobacteriota bacterium]